jgi:hypothetical protein
MNNMLAVWATELGTGSLRKGLEDAAGEHGRHVQEGLEKGMEKAAGTHGQLVAGGMWRSALAASGVYFLTNMITHFFVSKMGAVPVCRVVLRYVCPRVLGKPLTQTKLSRVPVGFDSRMHTCHTRVPHMLRTTVQVMTLWRAAHPCQPWLPAAILHAVSGTLRQGPNHCSCYMQLEGISKAVTLLMLHAVSKASARHQPLLMCHACADGRRGLRSVASYAMTY